MIGLSWFGVLTICELARPSATSQAQPLPKRFAPASSNCSLNVVEAAEGRR